jgi:hypothetical protein
MNRLSALAYLYVKQLNKQHKQRTLNSGQVPLGYMLLARLQSPTQGKE